MDGNFMTDIPAIIFTACTMSSAAVIDELKYLLRRKARFSYTAACLFLLPALEIVARPIDLSFPVVSGGYRHECSSKQRSGETSAVLVRGYPRYHTSGWAKHQETRSDQRLS